MKKTSQSFKKKKQRFAFSFKIRMSLIFTLIFFLGLCFFYFIFTPKTSQSPNILKTLSSYFPKINVSLNALTTLFITLGLISIYKKHKTLHQASMIMAMVLSTLFLGTYVIYHFYHGSVTYQGQGMGRYFYYTILITHIILSMFILPLVCMTVFFAISRRFTLHKKMAKITYPIWLYISITGMVIYWMLYQ